MKSSPYFTVIILLLLNQVSSQSIQTILINDRNLQTVVPDSCNLDKNKCDAQYCCAIKSSISAGKKFSNQMCIQPEFHNQSVSSPDGLTTHTFQCLEPQVNPTIINMNKYAMTCNTSDDCTYPCSQKCAKLSVLLTPNYSDVNDIYDYQQVNTFCIPQSLYVLNPNVSDLIYSYNGVNFNYISKNITTFQETQTKITKNYFSSVQLNVMKQNSSCWNYNYDDYYGEYEEFPYAIFFGITIGLPLGIVFCLVCMCCTSCCIGYTCYQVKHPGQFDNYHISSEINMHKIISESRNNQVQPIDTVQPQSTSKPEATIIVIPNTKKSNDMN